MNDNELVWAPRVSFRKYEHVKSAEEVMRLFRKESPGGSTNLAGVLEDAVMPDTPAAGGGLSFGRPETILVRAITIAMPISLRRLSISRGGVCGAPRLSGHYRWHSG